MLTLCLLAALATAGPDDLSDVYPATMSWSGEGLSWNSSPDDVWELKSFELESGKDLQLSCKKAKVAFGVHDTNVLWAVVFPEKPPKIGSRLAGDGETARTILLRFAPAEIDRVFPPRTVGDRGGAWLRAEAGRIFRHKIGWKWFTPAGNPTIVPAGFVIVDVDTKEGPRRFYGVNRYDARVEYVADFESKPVPPASPIAKKDALAAFDEVWEAFDREYAKFVNLPEVDWEKLAKQYRKAAGEADTVFGAAAVIADMLAHLEDLHVWVKAGEDWLPGYTRERPLNASWEGSKKLIGELTEAGSNLHWGRTSDGIGYLNVHGLNDRELPARVDEALEALRDTEALVVDLRFNGGGDELLAREVAGRFTDAERVYSLNQYRNGSKHDALGEKLERRFAPRGPWRYEKPVVALWGQRTLSSAESFALMLAQCPQVTTMGDRTGGSSGNPRRIELDCGITVNLPRWLDMDPEGNPIEGHGAAPDVQLDYAPDTFTATSDPVLATAVQRLK